MMYMEIGYSKGQITKLDSFLKLRSLVISSP